MSEGVLNHRLGKTLGKRLRFRRYQDLGEYPQGIYQPCTASPWGALPLCFYELSLKLAVRGYQAVSENVAKYRQNKRMDDARPRLPRS